MVTSRIADSVGRVLGGRYRLTRPLGVGASAHVFAAEDVQLRRRVAVKVLHPALAGEEAFLRRFRREAQAVAALRHASILRVYDWGEDDGSPYLIMELLEGGSLRSVLDGGNLLTPAQAAAVGADAARALAYAHRQGIVHRDVKPANLIFDDEGRVSVADFGLARALAEAAWTEPAGAVVGTARYASPELARGEHLDNRADVYSLAIVLVEATTGQVPFAADTAIGTLMARVGRDLAVPDGAGPLKPVLEAAGRADPAQRLDAAGLAAELDRVASALPPPGPLPLAGPIQSGLLERDDLDPTEFPGRPRLFDLAEWPDRPGQAGAGTDGEPAGPHLPAAGPTPPEGDPPPPSARTAPEETGAGETAAEASGAGKDEPAGRPRRRLPRVLVAAVVVVLLLGGGGAAWAVLASRVKPKHPVPQLVREPRATAAATLARLHFKLAVSGSEYNGRIPAGAVIRQQPSTGRLAQGSTVTVVLSLGPQPVPVQNLAGDSQQAAQQVITGLGLEVGHVTDKPSMTVPAGIVIGSTPDSGTVLPGTPVDLVVSSGKPQVAVPNLGPSDGASYAAAQAALSAVGLGATETVAYSDTVPAGQVMAFSPGPGATVTVGTTVTVEVSKGPHMVTVPNVVGMSVGAASQAVANAGLTVSGVTGNPLATVVSSNPPAGRSVHIGGTVQLVTG